jgi:hypothetical protein
MRRGCAGGVVGEFGVDLVADHDQVMPLGEVGDVAEF